MKKILSIFLVALLICTVMLPVTASAATVLHTAIVKINEPFAGDNPDFAGTVLSTGCEIDSITYRDINKTTDKWLEQGDGKRFEKGHSYEVIIVLDSKSGYEFATNPDGTPNVSGTINGFTTTVSREEGTIATARIELRYTFNSVNELVNKVKVNIREPYAGETPDYTGTVTGTGFEIDNIMYRDINKTSDKWLEPGDGKKFEKGHSYEAIVVLDSTDGYEFATNPNGTPNVAGTFNGYSVTPEKEDGTFAFARIVVRHTFNNTPELIKNVAVNIKEPAAGETPDYTGTVTGTGFEIDNIMYRDINKTSDKWLEPGDGKKFEAGATYEATVVLDPKSGYEFATNANGTPNVSGTINGYTATVSKQDGTFAFARIVLEYTFKPAACVNHVYDNDADSECNICGATRKLGAQLIEEYGAKFYYLDGEKQIDVTGLVKIDGVWYYIQNGRWATEVDTLHKLNGKWFLIKGGIWKAITGLEEYKGKTFYVVGGKWNSDVTDLKKVDGKWYYIQYGKWNNTIDTLHKINGKWFLIKKGMWNKTTGLVDYKDKTFYVVGGKWNSSVNTLYKKGSKFYAIKSGKLYEGKTIITYNGKKFYCNKGYAQLSFSGKVKIGTKTYTIKAGKVV